MGWVKLTVVVNTDDKKAAAETIEVWSGLKKILSVARNSSVEIETSPDFENLLAANQKVIPGQH